MPTLTRCGTGRTVDDVPGSLMDVRETAPLLQVSPNTLYLMIAEHRSRVEPVRIGRKIRFRRVDVEAFLGVKLRDEVAP